MSGRGGGDETRARILLVEDDEAIRTALEEKLRLEGYGVITACDGEEARVLLADERIDLVVLDRMLPRLDGLDVLRWLRGHFAELPVLILSARGSEDEKIEGLRRGADDYLAKPFGVRELLARIEALLRRSRGPKVLRFGDIEIDLEARSVRRGGKAVRLSRKELDVLAFLVRHRERIVSREEIHAAVWGRFDESGERQVDYHIAGVRKKLERDPRAPVHLLTHHGLGFEWR
ncbi:MAG TPA: response regulator transcription factor [Planctomycetota bacterium]|nr:response regulator transcription factor [Planctomycetota bacterium]